MHSNMSESNPKKSTVTTIRIHTDVRAKLEAIKMHRRETVEDVIFRLLNIYDELASVSKQYLGTTPEDVLRESLKLYKERRRLAGFR